MSRRSPLKGIVRLLALIVGAVGAALAIAMGVQWSQEWPLRKARTALAAGDATRAVALTDYFLDGHPGHGEAAALKARALMARGEARVALGDTRAAVEDARVAIGIYDRVGAATPEDMHAWARAYLVQESWSRGVQFLKQYLRMRPDDADALYELAMSEARIGLFDDALAVADRYRACPGQEARGTLLQAILHHDVKDDDAALAAFSRLMELAPTAEGLQLPPEEVFALYGSLLLAEGNASAAAEWLAKSQALRPSGATLYDLGRAKLQTGDPAAAVAAWKQALEVDPRGVSPREALAEEELTAGRIDEAAAWLEPLRAVAAERTETAYLFQRLAAARRDTADFERWKRLADRLRAQGRRIQALDTLMVSTPASPWAIALRAHRFAAAGNWAEADDLMLAVTGSVADEPFIRDLRAAIRARGTLPSLEGVPIEAH